MSLACRQAETDGEGPGQTVLDVLLSALLAGLAAGVLATLVAWAAVEPALDRAIGLEEEQAEGEPGHAHEASPVPRSVQRTVGLAAGTVAVAAAAGLACGVVGIAAARGGSAREALRGAREAALLGGYAVGLVPALAYPANPPGVGDPDTAGERTLAYLGAVAFGLTGALAAVLLRRLLGQHRGRIGRLAFAAVLAGGAGAAVVLLEPVSPGEGYPADLLWEFRRGSLLVQAGLWLALAGMLWWLEEEAKGRSGVR
jgi:hypothetical protein